MKLYSVSTTYYYGFGVLIPEELSSKFYDMPNVTGVLPDCYLNFEAKDYGGEPFINGEPVPYDPKYHASSIEFGNRMRGIGIDLDEDVEEMEDTNADADPNILYIDADAELPNICADAELPNICADADNNWYTPRGWLSKARAWWKSLSM